jgi:hypothetical protein
LLLLHLCQLHLLLRPRACLAQTALLLLGLQTHHASSHQLLLLLALPVVLLPLL